WVYPGWADATQRRCARSSTGRDTRSRSPAGHRCRTPCRGRSASGPSPESGESLVSRRWLCGGRTRDTSCPIAPTHPARRGSGGRQDRKSTRLPSTTLFRSNGAAPALRQDAIPVPVLQPGTVAVLLVGEGVLAVLPLKAGKAWFLAVGYAAEERVIRRVQSRQHILQDGGVEGAKIGRAHAFPPRRSSDLTALRPLFDRTRYPFPFSSRAPLPYSLSGKEC